MAGLWQRTGTVTVMNGSKTVTGSGTKWKTGTPPIQKGHTFYGPDNWAYEVDTVVSDTEILLVENYRGGTLANQAYRIDITRTSTISQFAADLASLVGKYRSWFDGMMTWLTGSGDVAILNPDTGANVTIPSWKKVASEGEGQAARAKTEADKAAASAALAGDIVVASALPLPDVWVPLSNSLRMITGYGREVKVGEDVVSQMVNFSRNSTATYIGKDGQLKTAAVNEPRFEKEGLLVEGQSTNVFNWVAGASYSWLSTEVTQSAGTAQLPFDVFQKTITSSTLSPTNTNRVLADIYSVLNPVASGGGPVTASVIMFGDADAILAADPRMNITSNLPITNVTYSAVKLNSGMVRVMWTGTVTAGSYTNFANFQVSWLNRLPSVVVGCYQVETLPFASSYIPTNGSAVTRAADYVAIPRDGNLPTDAFTFCVTVADFSTFDSTYQSVVFAPESSSAKERFYLSHGADKKPILAIGRDIIKAPSANLLVKPIGVSVSIGGGVKLFCNGSVQGSASAIGAIALDTTLRIGGYKSMSQAGGLFGHVRDFRIWQHAVTDEQLKAIA